VRDGALPVAVAHFRYGTPRAKLVERVRSAAAEGKALDNPPATLHGELEEREAFFACGLLHEQWGLPQPAYRGRRVPFLIRDDLLLGDPREPKPDKIELDPGEGGGFREVQLGTPLFAKYPGPSTVQVSVRCHYGKQARTARFTLTLSDTPAAPVPDERWPLRGACGNTGTAYVYRAAGRDVVAHPLIMVEGFPGGHAPDYLYDTLNQHGTADALRRAGYDVVIVVLDQGTDMMQRNAEVLIDCVRQAIAKTDEELVVGGMSMGGLISRFALAAMETRGEPHRSRTFLTIDTPHTGSYTSLAAQWFVHAFARYLPGLGAYAALLDSPANQQFVRWWIHDHAASESSLRKEFVEELQALGDYPKLPRKLAVSSGSGDGKPVGKAGTVTLSWSGEPWVSAELRAIAATEQTLGAGFWFLAEPQRLARLRFKGSTIWDVAPGGQDPYNALVAAIAHGSGCGTVTEALGESCAVPTVSALGLPDRPFDPVPDPSAGESPFDDYACSPTNEPHLTITAELSAWLLAALGRPSVAKSGVAA
jgi:hypothetical protein